jgi:hypothetical protein
MIERISYGGWKNNVRMTNGKIELVATLDVGPRVIRLAEVGGANLFNEFEEQLGKSGEGDWQIRGGHRFWHAPEAIPRTYILDNYPVKCEELGELSFRVTPAAETENGIQKEIEISMAKNERKVTLRHRMTNIGRWEIELAPWSLSVMARGGRAIMPLSKKQPHFERPNPAYSLTFWAYTDLSDPRLRFGSKYITIDHAKANGPSKWGMNVEAGWVAYAVNGMLFVKSFAFDAGATYPDNGCNFETYSDERIMELETLGAMRKLEPGKSLEHVETWRVFTDVPAVSNEQDIDQVVQKFIKA